MATDVCTCISCEAGIPNIGHCFDQLTGEPLHDCAANESSEPIDRPQRVYRTQPKPRPWSNP